MLEDYNEQTSLAIMNEVLIPYINEIFAFQYQRQQINDQDQGSCAGLTKITFKDYCCLPGVLSDRFFAVLDSDNDGVISRAEFVNALS